MNRFKQFLLALGVIALLPAIALAVPLSKDEQNCLNTVSKGLALIAKSQQKENASCIKNYSKGKSAVSECVAQDPKDKVSKQVDKLATLVAKKCPASVAASIESKFGPEMLARAQGEGQNEPTRLSNAIFGLSLDEALSTAAADGKGAPKCQQGILKEVFKCADTMRKEFLACKKSGLKSGAITDAATLQSTCMNTSGTGIPDVKGKIQKACSEKVLNAEDKKCSGSTSAEIVDALFPGPACQAGSGADNPGECLQAAVRCDLCNSINSTFGTSADCDDFDNSADDDSCGACRNANDQALIANTNIGAVITILGCAPSYDAACVGGPLGGVMQEETCAQCYGSSITCGATNCGAECTGPDAEACTACVQEAGCLDCL